MNSRMIGSAAALLAAAFSTTPAVATPVLCENPVINHMFVDSAYVSSCVDAGMGNVNGNKLTDDFLIANPTLDYTGIGSADYAQEGNKGDFILSASLWDAWDSIAVGFKFGTGRFPDQWFIYLLNPDVVKGYWEFINVGGTGGGLSHVQLYGVERSTSVPEPTSLALLSIGALALGLARRRKVS